MKLSNLLFRKFVLQQTQLTLANMWWKLQTPENTAFQKAFDHGDHFLLISRMLSYSFSSSLISIFQSYLQYVSKSYIAISGVPKESNLGPSLHLLHISDIVDTIACEKLVFPDILKIFLRIDSMDDQLKLQNDLDNIFH